MNAVVQDVASNNDFDYLGDIELYGELSKQEEKPHDLKITALQDLKKDHDLTKITTELKTVLSLAQALSIKDQNSLVQVLKLSEKEFPTSMQNIPTVILSPFETLQKTYKPFPHNVSMTAENILAHLKTELRYYVVFFGANKNYIYLDEFKDKTVEPRADSIITILSRERKIDNKIPNLSDIIPKKTIRIQKENNVKEQALENMINELHLSFSQQYISHQTHIHNTL